MYYNYTCIKNQEVILIFVDVVGCQSPWFRDLMKPRFKSASRRSVGSKISVLSEETKSSLLKEISAIARHAFVTVDFWTGRDSRSFMGCTVHYVYDQQLKHTMLCFKEVPPPHTSENIKLHEDQLGRYEIQPSIRENQTVKFDFL